MLANVGVHAAVLARVCEASPPGARAWHPAGMADAEGFLAMGCDEILVHTFDIATGLGVGFHPPDELCAKIVARLFPWTSIEASAWEALLWSNGRVALPGLERLDENWYWWCAPLEGWDGEIKRRTSPPNWI